MVKVDTEDGAAWKSRCDFFNPTKPSKAQMCQQAPCGTTQPWLETGDMECEDEAEKLGADKTPLILT